MRWRRMLPLLTAVLMLPTTATTEPIPLPAMPAILPETPPPVPPLPPSGFVIPALPVGLVVQPCATCGPRKICDDVKKTTSVAYSTRTVEFCAGGSPLTKRVLVKKITTSEEHRATVVVPSIGLATVPFLPPR